MRNGNVTEQTVPGFDMEAQGEERCQASTKLTLGFSAY